MDLRSNIMGRVVSEPLPKIKRIYNQYAMNANLTRNHAQIYTVPAGKAAILNFESSTAIGTNSGPLETYNFALTATVKDTSPRLHTVFALGQGKQTSTTGHAINFRPWWLFQEGQYNGIKYMGQQGHHWSGLSSSRFIQNMWTGNDNALSTSLGNVYGQADWTSNYVPYNNQNVGSTTCDAHKDFRVDENTIINFHYYVSTSGTHQSNPFDISLTVQEIERFA